MSALDVMNWTQGQVLAFLETIGDGRPLGSWDESDVVSCMADSMARLKTDAGRELERKLRLLVIKEQERREEWLAQRRDQLLSRQGGVDALCPHEEEELRRVCSALGRDH